MSVDELIRLLEQLQADGYGENLIVIPSSTGGNYTPSGVYEFDDDIHIN